MAINKGVGRSSELNQTYRGILALSLLTGTKLIVRWIPSELNPSDGPSRGKPWVGGLAPVLQGGAPRDGPNDRPVLEADPALSGTFAGRKPSALPRVELCCQISIKATPKFIRICQA